MTPKEAMAISTPMVASSTGLAALAVEDVQAKFAVDALHYQVKIVQVPYELYHDIRRCGFIVGGS